MKSFFGKNKHKNKILYQRFRECQTTIPASSIVPEMPASVPKKKTGRGRSWSLCRMLVIRGITEGIGCTYFADAYKALYHSENMSVCIILEEERTEQMLEQYDAVILDAGTRSSQRPADKKILITNLKPENLQRLSEFVTRPDAKEWIYFFTGISTRRDQNRVWTLMEDFNYLCVPEFIKTNPGKKVQKKLKSVLT